MGRQEASDKERGWAAKGLTSLNLTDNSKTAAATILRLGLSTRFCEHKEVIVSVVVLRLTSGTVARQQQAANLQN